MKTTIHCLSCGALSDVNVTFEAGAATPTWHCPACGEKARVMDDRIYFELYRPKGGNFSGSPGASE